ncbi:MAG: recombination mediator RecR [Bacilli bacterium]|nr:recombination mediator RecR [Bacilli bacterium]
MYPECLKNLIECLKDFPGVGDKSAERMAFAIMNFDKERITFFSDSLIAVRDNIRRCSVCNNITDKEVCSICSNNARKKDVIFVVEKPKDVILFEKINYFNGVYHVLDGLISPLEGINPEDINIKRLIERIDEDNVKEVILALKPSIEGETTMQYIRKLLENKNVKVTKIATGIPIGTDMEYIDSMTLELSLEERKEFS